MIDRNRDILRALRGDTVLAARNENVPLSISERAGYAGRASAQSLGEADGHAEGAVRHRGQGVRRRTGEAEATRRCGPAGAGEEARRLRRAVDAGAIADVGETIAI